MPNIIIENLLKAHITRAIMVKNGFSAQKYDDVCRERSNYKIDEIVKISEKFQLSLDYLIKGSDPNDASLTSEEKKLLEIFKKLDNSDKTRISERAETLAELAAERAAQEAEKISKEKKKASGNSKLSVAVPAADEAPKQDEEFYIDLCNLPVSAGTGVYLDEGYTEPLQIRRTAIAERANYAVRVSGNSMETKFYDGDIVLVETCPYVEVGEIGIFIVNDEGFIKKRGEDRLISLNPKCDDVIIHEYDTVYCRGRVLGKAEIVE